MTIKIRNYQQKDLKQILELIKELAKFEKAEKQVSNRVELMEDEMDYFDCFVAEDDKGSIIGMALFYNVYYTWVGKSLYLDDLIVKEVYRGKNIGTQLLDAVIEEAKRRKCKRLRWQVLDWNEKAIDMYKSYGCKIEGEWLNCDLSFN